MVSQGVDLGVSARSFAVCFKSLFLLFLLLFLLGHWGRREKVPNAVVFCEILEFLSVNAVALSDAIISGISAREPMHHSNKRQNW